MVRAKFVHALFVALEERRDPTSLCWWSDVGATPATCFTLAARLAEWGRRPDQLGAIPPHALVVLDTDRFVDTVMQDLCSSDKFMSFRRQLSHYGFQRISKLPFPAFIHDHFQPGRADLLGFFSRRRADRAGGALDAPAGVPPAPASAAAGSAPRAHDFLNVNAAIAHGGHPGVLAGEQALAHAFAHEIPEDVRVAGTGAVRAPGFDATAPPRLAPAPASFSSMSATPGAEFPAGGALQAWDSSAPPQPATPSTPTSASLRALPPAGAFELPPDWPGASAMARGLSAGAALAPPSPSAGSASASATAQFGGWGSAGAAPAAATTPQHAFAVPPLMESPPQQPFAHAYCTLRQPYAHVSSAPQQQAQQAQQYHQQQLGCHPVSALRDFDQAPVLHAAGTDPSEAIARAAALRIVAATSAAASDRASGAFPTPDARLPSPLAAGGGGTYRGHSDTSSTHASEGSATPWDAYARAAASARSDSHQGFHFAPPQPHVALARPALDVAGHGHQTTTPELGTPTEHCARRRRPSFAPDVAAAIRLMEQHDLGGR